MKEERPILDLPKTQTESILDGLAAAGLITGLAVLFFSYGDLPDRIPTHFNGSGEPDGFSSKSIMWILMSITLIMAFGMWYLTRIPHKFNYLNRVTAENAEETYYRGRLLIRVLNTGIIWIFIFIIWRTVEVVKGEAAGLGQWFLPVVLIVTLVVPIYMVIKMSANSK